MHLIQVRQYHRQEMVVEVVVEMVIRQEEVIQMEQHLRMLIKTRDYLGWVGHGGILLLLVVVQ